MWDLDGSNSVSLKYKEEMSSCKWEILHDLRYVVKYI